MRRMYSVLSSTCHQPPNTEPVTIPLSLVVHATFKSNIPFIQNTLPQLSNKNAVGQCQKPYKSLSCSLPFPHPYYLLRWNGWLLNQTGREWILLSKPMFTDPDYLLGLHMLRNRLWEVMCHDLPRDWVWAAQSVTPWIHFLILDTHSISFFFLSSFPLLSVTFLYNNGLSQMMDTCHTTTASSFTTS